MESKKFVSYIEKYYLGGNVEEVVWNISIDNQAVIEFTTAEGSCAGNIIFPNPGLPEGKIAIFNTSSLIKVLSIYSDDINVNLETDNYTSWLKINDKNYETKFTLADIARIQEPVEITEPGDYDIVINISDDFSSKFLKSKKALSDIDRFTIESTGEDVVITITDNTTYSNKLSFKHHVDLDSEEHAFPMPPLPFSAKIFKEILDNNAGMVKGTMFVSQEGFLKICFEHADQLVTQYYLVANDEL